MNNPYDIIISNNNNATSFVELNDQYNALYNLLINNQREISYLDLYKITEYVNTPKDMVQIGSKFAQLNPNTAIGIGVPSVSFNGETFYQGDLLLKLSNGQMQKLDAPSHGIYFPRWKEEGTSKKLTWVYSKDEPTKPSDGTDPQPVEMTDKTEAEWLLYRDILPAKTSNGYGQKILSTSFTLDTLTNLVPDISTSTGLVFSGEMIKYGEKTIVERKDGKLCYYLFNLPNRFGIRIKEDGSTCYIAEGKKQEFLLDNFVYHNESEFIVTKNQKESDDYLTINWNGENWIAIYVYSKYGVTLNFSGEIIKYNNNIIVERKDSKLYYYFYNLPQHFGIRVKEDGSVCYMTKDEQQNISLNNFVYHNENEFIIVENQKESDDYFTIDWNEEKWAVINVIKTQSTTIDRIDNLVPIIKCFTINNEEILADIKIESTTTTKTNNNETIITNIYQVSNIPYCVNYLMIR